MQNEFSTTTKDMDANLEEFQKWLFVPEQAFGDIQAESPEDFIAQNQSLISIIENVPNGVTILSTDFKILYTNKKMRDWFARNLRNYKIKCYRLFHNGQKAPCPNCPALASMQTKMSASVVHDCGIDEETGKPMYMHIHTFPVLNKNGEVTAFVEYSYNLTEQRKSSQKLEEIESRCTLLEHENQLLKKALEEQQAHVSELENSVNDNMENYVKPALEFLKSRITPEEQNIVSSMIEESLFPITKKRAARLTNLSSREIQVATLIRDGYSSKEIADSLCITKKAVDFHRANIRKKLEIDSSANLQTYLTAYM